MPKSITFFSRGKTPIYVNYVIAHNTRGRPVRNLDDSSSKLIGKFYMSRSGRPTWRPYRKKALSSWDSAFFLKIYVTP